MSICQEFSAVREAADITQHQLAFACGLTRMSVQRANTGLVNPKLSSVVEMTRALGQPPGVGAPPSIADVVSKR